MTGASGKIDPCLLPSTSGLLIEVNGVPTPSQVVANFIAGTNIVITADAFGGITIDGANTSSTSFSAVTSGTNLGQTLIVGPGSSLTVACPGSGSPPGTGIIEATELATNTCTPVVTNLSAPTHAGMLLISQPGNDSAIWADPQVQGLYPAGSTICPAPAYVAPTCIQPVLVGAEDPGGLLQNLQGSYFGSPAKFALDVYVVNPLTVTFTESTIGVTQSTTPWVVSGAVAVSGTVAVSNFPTTFNITGQTYTVAGSPAVSSLNVFVEGGTVAVSNFPASFIVNQGTSPWAVSLASTTITGTVTTAGSKTNNNAAPGATNIGALVAQALATPAAGYTTGNEVLLVTDLAGNTNTDLQAYNNNAVVSNGVSGLIPIGDYGTSVITDATWSALTGLNSAITFISSVEGYSTIALTFYQTVSFTSGAVTFEISNDNVNWYPIEGFDPKTGLVVPTTYTLSLGYTVLVFNVPTPYFRVRLSTAIGAPATALFTDNFAYAHGDLNTANPLWVPSGQFVVVTGGVSSNSGNLGISYTGVTPGNDQQAYVTIANPTWRVGPAVRSSSSSVTSYFARPGGGGVGTDIYKVIGGAYTALGTQPATTPWATGDILRIVAQGTTISVYRNGGLLSSVTDSSIASGYGGMFADSPNITMAGASSFSVDNYPSASNVAIGHNAKSLPQVHNVVATQGTTPWVVTNQSETFTALGSPAVSALNVNVTGGSMCVTQCTVPWLVEVMNFPAAQVVTGTVKISNFPATVSVTQSTSPWVVSSTGTLANNNAAPAATNVGVLPAVASLSPPKDNEGRQVLLSTDLQGVLRVGFGGESAGAFGRGRVVQPVSEFSSQFQYDTNPLLFNTALTGTGTVTKTANESSLTLSTGGTASGAQAINQTKSYFRYEPGKSQLILLTGFLGVQKANVQSRIGYFDANDGLYFEMDGTLGASVNLRTSTSGSPVVTQVLQANWNLDPMDGTGGSGLTINWADTQIFSIDFQWDAGRVRFGVDRSGSTLFVHEFNLSNLLTSPYMNTANLPVRAEITNTGTAASTTTMKQTSVSVITEGGIENTDSYRFEASNKSVAITAASGTRTPLVSIQPKVTFNSIVNRAKIDLETLEIFVTGANSVYWELVWDGTLTGSPVFNSADPSSLVNFDIAATGCTGGIVIASGYGGGGAGSTKSGTGGINIAPNKAFTLNLAGNAAEDTWTLCATGIGGTAPSFGVLSWSEVR
jgi:hypothetical protein